jgi:aldehyde dehydrogenase family 7 protein A1
VCTVRLYLHEAIHDQVLQKLLPAYASVKIGNPLEAGTLCGPLINQAAVDLYSKTIEEATAQGGKLLFGGQVRFDLPGYFVTPTIFSISPSSEIIQHERFIPVLYVMKVRSYEEAVEMNNSVAQGLSSSLFTTDPKQIFHWTGTTGSDCGIVNVNVGTSGAEIGGESFLPSYELN